ncbi:IgGFc-binding protein [Teredinibacter turnerae]|uniref:IgGFc-binding protein n=1 Tax=Teredinibacter turnerae TaxID=2426 RepID=UPI000366E9E2|nr:IgGFc-binding protein [Teredinibacter turnerae]
MDRKRNRPLTGWIGRVATLCLCFVVGAMAARSYAAQDNFGKEFLLPFLPNAYGAVTLQVHLTGNTTTDVSLSYPMNNPTFTTTVTVLPGTVTVVDIPLSADDWIEGAVADNLVFAESDEEFVAYLVNLYPQSSDAALALPVDTMNTQYIVASYPSTFSTYGFNSQMMVYAAYDGTVVTVTPKVAAGSHSAGTPYTVNIDRGEAYYITGNTNGAGGDLSGTEISSTRPVGVINGNQCTQIPNGTPACDHIFEVAQPVQSWGQSALVANLPNRSGGSIYRIYASEDGTDIGMDQGILATGLNKGEFHETGILNGNYLIESNNPIFVTQLMTGQNSYGADFGDPAMGNMIPSAQYLSSYTFSTVGANQFAEHYLTLFARDSNIGSVLLDGAPIPASQFSSILFTGYSVAILPLSQGVHSTWSPNPHGITVEGYNGYDSYIYPGGALFKSINPTGDAWQPVCSIAEVNGVYEGLVTDNKPSEDVNGNGVLDPGEDTNGNSVIDVDSGVFLLESLTLVNMIFAPTPFVPGDPQTSFELTVLDPTLAASASIRATDGAGNTCLAEVDVTPPPMMCDVDGDRDVDRDDVTLIRTARNTPATDDSDPRDVDGDQMITLNDARVCVTQCTRASCAVN